MEKQEFTLGTIRKAQDQNAWLGSHRGGEQFESIPMYVRKGPQETPQTGIRMTFMQLKKGAGPG